MSVSSSETVVPNSDGNSFGVCAQVCIYIYILYYNIYVNTPHAIEDDLTYWRKISRKKMNKKGLVELKYLEIALTAIRQC